MITFMYLLLLKFSSIQVLLSQYFLKYALIIACLVIGMKIIDKFFGTSSSVQRIIAAGFIFLGLFYIGFLPGIGVLVISYASYQIGKLAFGFKEGVLQFASG